MRDHRLRARFDLPAPAATMCTDTPLGWVERPAGTPPPAEGVEDPTPTHPVSSITTVACGAVRVGIGAVGLHEVELVPSGALLVTVVRAVGWMSRSDLASRRGHAGYQIETPAAQGRGRLRFRYAVAFEDAAGPAATLARALEPALYPPAAVALEDAPASERALFALEPPEVRLSTIKRAEADERLLVRLIGPDAGPPVLARLRFFRPIARAWRSDLDERAGTPLEVTDGQVALSIAAGEVETIAVLLGSTGGRARSPS
jgi:alpha-mannosidase